MMCPKCYYVDPPMGSHAGLGSVYHSADLIGFGLELGSLPILLAPNYT